MEKNWRTVGLLTVTLTGIGFIAGDAEGQGRRDRDERDRVCFYGDVEFQGWEQCYLPGDEVADLGGRRNQISSIRVSGRARVVVYDEREFDGASDEFGADVRDLRLRNATGSRTWNDRIDSIQVESGDRGRGRARGRDRRDDRDERNDRDQRDDRNGALGRGRDGVCVYELPDFRGRSECWEVGHEERNLNRLAGWNDRISSIRVFGRARVLAYRDADYRGERLQVDRDVPDLSRLRDANWDEQISSIEVR